MIKIIIALFFLSITSIMSENESTSKTFFEFNQADSSRWIAVNDNVMGGISEGDSHRNDENQLVFEGSLSLKNNGGFSSIRTVFDKIDLTGFKGIEINVKGDGRVYQFRVRDNKNIDGLSYKCEFETKSDKWQKIILPFESFIPTFRGYTPKNATPLNLENIEQFAFLIADKKEGSFSLIIESIKAYR